VANWRLSFPKPNAATILFDEVQMANHDLLIEVESIGEGSRKPNKIAYRWTSKDGRPQRLRIVDAESADFTEQLSDAFRSNVRKARAENREVDKAP
jgi:hypothetical protein